MSAIIVKGMKDVVKTLNRLERKSRYATAAAINQTALDLQTYTVKRILPDAFTLRAKGNPWQKPKTKYGINLKPFANVKRQGKNLHAIVGSRADWLAEQEKAGIKRRKTSLAVPTDLLKNDEDIVPRRLKPKRLIEKFQRQKKVKVRGQWVFPLTRKKGGSFKPIIEIASKRGFPGIWVRTQRNKIRMLYRFIPTARLVNKVRYNDKSLKRINSTWLRHFKNALDVEFATGKPSI